MSDERSLTPEMQAATPPRAWQEELGPINGEEQTVIYPDFLFDIEPERFSNSGVIEVTADARLRYCLKLIEASFGKDYEQFSSISHPNVRQSQLLAQKKFLTGTISLGKSGAKLQRSAIVDSGVATDEVYRQFAAVHHPAWQLTEQLARHESIRPSDVTEARRSLSVVFAWNELKTIYNTQITNYKQFTT